MRDWLRFSTSSAPAMPCASTMARKIRIRRRSTSSSRRMRFAPVFRMHPSHLPSFSELRKGLDGEATPEPLHAFLRARPPRSALRRPLHVRQAAALPRLGHARRRRRGARRALRHGHAVPRRRALRPARASARPRRCSPSAMAAPTTTRTTPSTCRWTRCASSMSATPTSSTPTPPRATATPRRRCARSSSAARCRSSLGGDHAVNIPCIRAFSDAGADPHRADRRASRFRRRAARRARGPRQPDAARRRSRRMSPG